jgi:RNase H-fold protein (predicted Holliday junction resolvase)
VRVLSVDPGREKCGVAVVDERDGVLARGVIPTGVVGHVVRDWARAHRAERIVMGNGTYHREVRKSLPELDLPLDLVAERHTTQRARRRYFQEHPPRGLWRLIPLGLRTPPMPVDDYAAILIAEDYLRRSAERG